jgi:hypothetical protein
MVSGWISANHLPHLKPSKESLIAFVDRMSERQLQVADPEPPLEGVNMQKSPEVPATLQVEYVGILLKDGSQVIMMKKTYDKLISEKFFKKGGRWIERVNTFHSIFIGTKKDVESMLKAALVAEKKRVEREAKEAESAALLKTLLKMPSLNRNSGSLLKRENACKLLNLDFLGSELPGEEPVVVHLPSVVIENYYGGCLHEL